MIEASSACTTAVGWVVTIWPEVLVTTRSSRVTSDSDQQADEEERQHMKGDAHAGRFRRLDDLRGLRLEEPDELVRRRVTARRWIGAE